MTINRHTLKALAFALITATIFTGCPGSALTPYVGLWTFGNNFTAGNFQFELLANGTVQQTDTGDGLVPGSFTWDLLTATAIVLYQDDGVNQSVLTGAFISNDSIEGVSIQTDGVDTGLTGFWSLTRVIP